MRITINCFGGLHILSDVPGGEGHTAGHTTNGGRARNGSRLAEPPFSYRKSKAIAAYLAVTGGTTTRLQLANLLWSDLDERRGLSNVRVVVGDLRRHLGNTIATGGGSVWLETDRIAMVDCWALAESWTVPSGPGHTLPHATVEAMAAAVDSYGGPFLDGFVVDGAEVFDEWVGTQRETFHRRALTTLQVLADHFLEQGDTSRVIDTCSRMVSLEPWHEQARRTLMDALSLAGHPDVALAEYRKLRGVLERELGAEPEHETVALAERIDLQRSLRVERRPPLPAPPSSIVGRDEEIAIIEKLLTHPSADVATGPGGISFEGTRLLTLCGPGGVGKTRLAHQALIQLEPTARDGAALVDLSATTRASAIAGVIAASIRLPLAGLRDPLDELCDALDRSDLVLLLDNLEQLMPDAPSVVARLIASCPGLRILATSRAPLGARAERVLPVLPLSDPDMAMQLFVERARSAGFSPAAGDNGAIREICRHLDGMPLAIELAAARTRVTSLTDMEASLAQRIEVEFLRDRSFPGDRPERHRSIADSIDWSYRMLDDDARRLLRYLSVFRGGVPWDIVRTALVPSIAPASSVAALVENSLVEHLHGPGSSRLRLLEATRAFAGEELVSHGEVADAEMRHLEGVLDLAERGDRGLRGSEQLAWLDRLGTDLGNIHAAMERAPDIDPAGALRLATYYGWYCNMTGRVREGIGALDAALSSSPGSAADPLPFTSPPLGDRSIAVATARALMMRALISVRMTDAETIGRYANDRVLETAGSLLKNPGEMENSDLSELLDLAELNHLRGYLPQYAPECTTVSLSESIPPMQTSLEQLAAFGDPVSVEMRGRLLLCIASSFSVRGDYHRSVELARRAHNAFEQIGNKRGTCMALAQTGLALAMTGQPDAAAPMLAEVVSLARELGDLVFIAWGLRALGAIRCLQWHQDRTTSPSEAVAEGTGALDRASQGARLFGAADRLSTTGGFHLPAPYVTLLDEIIAGPRAALGDAEWERCIARGWDEGLEIRLSASTSRP